MLSGPPDTAMHIRNGFLCAPKATIAATKRFVSADSSFVMIFRRVGASCQLHLARVRPLFTMPRNDVDSVAP